MSANSILTFLFRKQKKNNKKNPKKTLIKRTRKMLMRSQFQNAFKTTENYVGILNTVLNLITF